MSGLADNLQEFIDGLAESKGIAAETIQNQFERSYDIDLTEVSEDDAKTFIDGIENDEFGKSCDVLRDYGADDESVDLFRQQMEQLASQEADSGNTESSTSSDSVSSGGSGGLSEAEIDRKIQSAVPDASEIARELQSQMGGGGGGQTAPQGQSAEEQGNQLGQMMSLAQLMMDGGGGGGLGQEFQEMAMKSFIADMRKPDLGDLLERQYYEKVLGSDAVEDIYGDYMPDVESDDDENDDPFAEFA